LSSTWRLSTQTVYSPELPTTRSTGSLRLCLIAAAARAARGW
jgi:hypothetical protein